jgi:hypothetical protein
LRRFANLRIRHLFVPDALIVVPDIGIDLDDPVRLVASLDQLTLPQLECGEQGIALRIAWVLDQQGRAQAVAPRGIHAAVPGPKI